MRFLADENFPGAVVEELRATGHDIVWIRTEAPGVPDDEVLARALSEQRVLLTFDKDFGEMVFARGASASSGIVLFRLPLPSPEEVKRSVVAVLRARSDWAGRFAVVEPGRVRFRQGRR